MTLAYDFVVSGVLIAVSVIVHYISIVLFVPGGPLFAMAAEATMFDGAAKAQLWFEILSVWVPMAGVVVAIGWPIVRAYRRQATTAARQVGP